MPDIAGAAAELPVETAILDGEVVAFDRHGISQFADLQAAFQEGRQRNFTILLSTCFISTGRICACCPSSSETAPRRTAGADRRQIATSIQRALRSARRRGFSQGLCAGSGRHRVEAQASAPYDSGRGTLGARSSAFRNRNWSLVGSHRPLKAATALARCCWATIAMES